MKVQVSKEKLIVSVLCFLYIFEYTLYGQPISGLKYIIQALCVFMFIKTTLIISKKPGNTGISRDIRTEFTTDLLLSD